MIKDAGQAGTDFARFMETLCNGVFRWAVGKGFETECETCGGKGGIPVVLSTEYRPCDKCNGTGSGYRNFGEQIALIHSEASELLDHHREGKMNEPDAKVPEFTKAEIEAADIVIRTMCMSGAYGWRLGRAIEAKMAYNDVRPYRHGKAY